MEQPSPLFAVAAATPTPMPACEPSPTIDSTAQQAPEAANIVTSDAAHPLVASVTATAAMHAPTAPTAAPDAVAVAKPKVSNNHMRASAGMNGGRWTEQEHQSFLAGLRLYGREWKKVASKIKTRTSAQIRSHAQKYFAKLARDDELRRHGGGAAGGLLVQPGFHPDGVLAPSMYGYFSDGGSSAALNSGDEDTGDNEANPVGEAARRPPQKCLAPAPSAVTGSPAQYQSAGPTTAFQYRQVPSSSSKKRSRSQSPVDCTAADPSLASGSPYQGDAGVKQRRLAAAKPAALELMPSQEELIEKASPNVRRRLSSLIEAELCALQVLSCYAMLQQHSQRPVHSPPFRAQPALGLAMISTEQLPSASSIY